MACCAAGFGEIRGHVHIHVVHGALQPAAVCLGPGQDAQALELTLELQLDWWAEEPQEALALGLWGGLYSGPALLWLLLGLSYHRR